MKDELNETTAYTHDASNRPQTVTMPEGNGITYGYDTRGNVTSTVASPKSGTGLANLTTDETGRAQPEPRVGVRMVAQLVSFGDQTRPQLRVPLQFLSNDEECRPYAFAFQ